MTIKGYQFDRAKVTALKDASLYSALYLNRSAVIPNRGDGLAVSTNGLDVIISTGQAIICGRLVEVTEPETVSIPANTAGYLVLTIDLSEANYSEGTPGESDYTFTNNQLRCEFVETLTQQDLNDNGIIYTFNLGTISSNSSGVTYSKNTEAWKTLSYDKLIRLNDVSDLLVQATTPKYRSINWAYQTNQSVILSRVGNVVTLNGYWHFNRAGSFNNTSFTETIPTGFVPSAQSQTIFMRLVSKQNNLLANIKIRPAGAEAGKIICENQVSVPVNEDFWLNCSWITSDPYPL